MKVEFTVYRETIIGNSEIVWSKKVAHAGYQYGLKFISVPVLLEVIYRTNKDVRETE